MQRSSALRLLTAGITLPFIGCSAHNTMLVPHVDPNPSKPTAFGAQLYSSDDIQKSLNLISGCAGRVIRFALSGFPSDITYLDTLFPAAQLLGMRVILVTGSSPQPVPLPSWIASWVAIQVRYAAYAPVWEIWNEPDLEAFWGARPNLDDYSSLAIATARALFAVGAKDVWSGGTSEVDYQWLRGLNQRNVFATLNGCAVHSYQAVGAAFDQYILAQGLLPAGVLLHTTETGVPTDQDQVDFLTGMWYVHRQLSLPTMIWVEFRDGTAGTSGPNSYPYGLVTSGYQPKPCYATAQQLAGPALA